MPDFVWASINEYFKHLVVQKIRIEVLVVLFQKYSRRSGVWKARFGLS